MQLPNPNYIFGAPGNVADSLTGTTSPTVNDVFQAGGGNDFISDLAGNDVAFGATGNDIFSIGSGSDILHGGEGDDDFNIAAGSQNATDVNVMHGGLGNDDFLIQDTGDFNAVLFGTWGAALSTFGFTYAPQNVLATELLGTPTEINVTETGGGNDVAFDLSGGDTIYYANGNDTGTYTISDNGGFDILELVDWTFNAASDLIQIGNDLFITEGGSSNFVRLFDFFNGNVVEFLEVDGVGFNIGALA